MMLVSTAKPAMTQSAVRMRDRFAGASDREIDGWPGEVLSGIISMRLKSAVRRIVQVKFNRISNSEHRKANLMKINSAPFLCTAMLGLAFTTQSLRAADHGDAPTVGPDQGADIADVYAFLDPNDNTQVVLIGTSRGFIVPAEAGNFGIFDKDVRYTFHVENTGDSTPDLFIDVTFNQPQRPPEAKDLPGFKGTLRGPQDAFISFRGKVPAELAGSKGKSHAPVTPATVLTNPDDNDTELLNAKGEPLGMSFFAGIVDDPFFFDIPAFGRFVASAVGGAPDFSFFNRARDSFAGYNVMAIAIRVPAAKLLSKGGTPKTLGISFSTSRKTQRVVKGTAISVGGFTQVDRMGVPGINVALVPYNHKNSYNGGTTIDDGKGKFFADIAGTLTALGTTNDPGNQEPMALSVLAGVAGLPSGPAPLPKGTPPGTGDYLRLDTSHVNSGPGGGNNTGAGFPNGRRLQDDVIDVILHFVTNGVSVNGDNVNANDKALRDLFPFLAAPNQPKNTGEDDNTRN
jgi:hypothetical protein